MDCCEFREKYSDFADGQLDDEAELRARRHLSLCAACRRFDAAFRTGVRALRDLPSVDVSGTFGERLKNQIRHELTVRALAVDPLSGAIAAMLVLVTIGLVTWDLAELHAARHTVAAVAVNPMPPIAIHVPLPVQVRIDTTQTSGDVSNPFDPVLLVADTSPAPEPETTPRFDIPAVWGGR
jgi:anti-sigma factor RsiW